MTKASDGRNARRKIPRQFAQLYGPGAAGRRAVHELVAETAKSMAAASYEELARDNWWYGEAKKQGVTQEVFVERMWPAHVEHARHTLAQMLAGAYPEDLKQRIHEALILDHELRLSAGSAVPGSSMLH